MQAQMRYSKALDQFDAYRSADWGTFCRYLEIGDDLFAVRQVDIYSNGNCLWYDREHWIDEFGELGCQRHSPRAVSQSQQRWTIIEVSAAEFEAVWNTSQVAPNQPQQYDASKYGDVREKLNSEMTPERLDRLPPWFAALFEE